MASGTLKVQNFFLAMPIMNGLYFTMMYQKYFTLISKGKDDVNKIFSILSEKSLMDPLEKVPNSYVQDKDKAVGRIEFKNVNFKYPVSMQIPVFTDLTLKIEPGKSVGFVGPSGCGKSTIVQLIERFYEIDSGEILIDGVEIKQHDIQSLRNIMAYVQQEPPLFKLSVMDNIRYGNPNSTDEEIRLIAQGIVPEEIMGQVEGNLVSPGQKQRIAIARALIKAPKILLLDEASSALDVNTETQVYKKLHEFTRKNNITTITIAHRFAVVKECDVIFVVEGGKIAEFGSHEELMSKQGRYYRLSQIY